MIDPLHCPVCEHWVTIIEKWRGLYLCTPCRKKYEKIESLIRDGQVLDHQSLQSILRYFGNGEMHNIKESEFLTVKNKRGRPKEDKTAIIGIVAPKRRKRKI
jgi:hypothetical protein